VTDTGTKRVLVAVSVSNEVASRDTFVELVAEGSVDEATSVGVELVLPEAVMGSGSAIRFSMFRICKFG
jgi:hypothetical protein